MWSTPLYDYLFLGVDSFVVGVLYYVYKKRDDVIHNILTAPSVAVGPALEDLLEERDKSVGYIKLRGKVHPFEEPIESQSGLKGVLQVITLNEHSVKRQSFGQWYENVRTLQQTQNSVPFALKNLANSGRKVFVEIENPLEADCENLLLPVSSNFAPSNTSVASTVLGFFTGYAPKGLETTEEFLPVGTVITAIGQVTRDSNGRIVMSESNQGDAFPYILSTLPAETIVKRLEGRNFYLKATTYFLAALGIIITVRVVNNWWKLRKEARMREHILKNRVKRDVRGMSEAEICVVCLNNPREIIIMDCGHVAVCADCCSKLSGKCPICRKNILGTHAAYIA